MSYVRANGVRIYYEEHGSGEPILLIHGAGSDATFWGGALDELAQLGRVIAYDRRGCSRSEHPESYTATSPQEQAADAAGLLEALEATPAVVVGRSLGGMVALELARTYPHLVRGLVLLEAGPSGLSPEADKAMDSLVAHVRAAASTHGVNSAAETLFRAVLHDAGWEALPSSARQRLTANSATLLAELAMPQPEIPDPELLRCMDVPVLVVGAIDSPRMFVQLNEALVHWLPNARLAHVGGGHRISPAEPEIISFIQSVFEASWPRSGHSVSSTG
jgi:esterase